MLRAISQRSPEQPAPRQAAVASGDMAGDVARDCRAVCTFLAFGLTMLGLQLVVANPGDASFGFGLFAAACLFWAARLGIPHLTRA